MKPWALYPAGQGGPIAKAETAGDLLNVLAARNKPERELFAITYYGIVMNRAVTQGGQMAVQ